MRPAPYEPASLSLTSSTCVHACAAVLWRTSRRAAAPPTAALRRGVRRRMAAQRGRSSTAPSGTLFAAPPTASQVRMQQHLVPRVLPPERFYQTCE